MVVRQPLLFAANAALGVLFVIAWFAPLMRAGLLPLFGMAEISIVTGLQRLWRADIPLALIVTGFALFAPLLKTLGLALIHLGLLSRRALPALQFLGKLAMADVFLVAVYIIVVKEAGMARVDPAWGLWLFTFCVLASIGLGHLTARGKRA
ncbi:MAG TPA: paraquat-inducible membrane protein A [Rhodobacteraceae bacterium]|jgi:paraquat-inducible protein A|nr:paraquat-inducible membrane protein A [Paracoccaceae bacterium]